MSEEKKFRHIVRILNTDIDGNKSILMALQKIKGAGFMMSKIICKISGIDESEIAGNMSDDKIKKIEEIISNPLNSGIPSWALNRRNDYVTGKDKHLFSGDLKYQLENDKKRLQRIKSYRGLRLAVGLTVRGQKTKSNFRRNKGKGLGVKKRSK